MGFSLFARQSSARTVSSQFTPQPKRPFVDAPVSATPRFQGPKILSSRDKRLSKAGLQSAFAEVRKLAGLDDKPLRPHDLRHQFAVMRLSLWHQERVDVQARLPLLATYLDHANYSDTADYLTGSADLLAIAAERVFLDGGAV
jgi:integrase